jgi:hypothetical protein
MNGSALPSRRFTLALAGLIALAGVIAVLATTAVGDSQAVAGHGHGHGDAVHSRRAGAFHDHMRALWEAHGSWTHMVIVSFVGNLPNLAAEEQVLLDNQVDIGHAVKPYYGAAASKKLTRLLQEHINGAVTVLQAAKSGDKSALSRAEGAWFGNGREIADFLHAANPRFLPRHAARQMMRTHLNQVIEQAVDELSGDYSAGARAFGPYIDHILDMADMISGGIIRQFPGRFR